MELRVENTLFNSNGGGNGGGFYQGRQDQGDQPRQQRPEPEDEAHLEGDAVEIQHAFRSRLAFLPTTAAPAVDLDALGDELKGRVRHLTLAISYMERKLDRATHAEVGCVMIA